MKCALLVMVHGSPRPASNGAMFRVVERVRERALRSGEYSQVEVGFMECNEPAIPEAIARCIEGGATRVVGVPYFLHSGNHVADDLPTLLEEARELYPEVAFSMGDYLGRDDALLDVIRARVQEAQVTSC
jgi:sirohydrochlorin ferrochelatase